jgi:lipoate-protein ligase A
LTNAYRKLPDYLKLPEVQRSRQKKLLEEKSVCMEDLNQNLSANSIIDALNKGFRSRLPFEAEEIPWSEEELHAIHSIAGSEEFKRQYLEIDRK